MLINSVLQKYPDLKRPEAIFEISNILTSQNEVKAYEDESHASFRRKEGSCLKGVKIKPPFATTWYDGYLAKQRLNFGFHCEEKKQCLYSRVYQNTIYGVIIVASQTIEMDDTFIIPEGSYADIWVNKDVLECKEDIKQYRRGFNSLFFSMHYTNGLLNCKNVSTAAHEFPNRRSIQHYKRISKPYFEKYYTLKIEVPGQKRIIQSSNEGVDGYTRAFHICRGHFKIYTEQNPLFGKFTGTYWWNSQVRGDIKTGIIDKDYELQLTNSVTS